ncbi:MAG: hypothetical protein ABI183_16335 [Polyangiaceae bacterium]
MPGGLIVFVILARVLYTYTRKNKNGVRPPLLWRTLRYTLIAIFLGCSMLTAAIAFGSALVFAVRDPETAVVNGVIFLIVASCGFLFFFPWLALMNLASGGNPKRAYYFAHALRFSYHSAEPYGAACFSAALAIARRGAPTRNELDWIQKRLTKETRALGLFGAALGLTQALEGRLAKDEGRHRDAEDFRERARVVFGTITYLSKAAVPRAVRIFTNDYLALDSAARGEWGGIESVEPRSLSQTTRALRGWLRKNLLKPDAKPDWRTRRAAKSPIARALAGREDREPRDIQTDALFARMNRDYVALLKGERLPPRAIMNLLHALDLFFDSRSPVCRLSPELVADEEALAEVGNAIADSVFEALRSRGAPIFALKTHRAISARVYQKLESAVMGDLNAAMAAVRERTVRFMRGTNRDEWLEVSRVRALYRRVEYTLGTPAAGSLVNVLLFNYGNFGVMLSESIPRRRPLAHAVFHVLRNEAGRFHNIDALARENKNMVVTSRAD